MSQNILHSTDRDLIETELYFETTLLESLDPSSEDYNEDRTRYERNIHALENRIDELEAMSFESPRTAMQNAQAESSRAVEYPSSLINGANPATNSSSSSSLFDPYNSNAQPVRKRPRESTFSSPQANAKFPRMTPSPSISGTSSPRSFESLEPEDTTLNAGQIRQSNLAERTKMLERAQVVERARLGYRETEWAPQYGRGQSLGQDLHAHLPSRPHHHHQHPQSVSTPSHLHTPQSASNSGPRFGYPGVRTHLNSTPSQYVQQEVNSASSRHVKPEAFTPTSSRYVKPEASNPTSSRYVKPEASNSTLSSYARPETPRYFESYPNAWSQSTTLSYGRPSHHTNQPAGASSHIIDLTGDSDDDVPVVQPKVYPSIRPQQRPTLPVHDDHLSGSNAQQFTYGDQYLYGREGAPGPAYVPRPPPLHQLGQYASTAWGSVRGIANGVGDGLRDVGNLLFPGGASGHPFTIGDESRLDNSDNRGWDHTPAETREQLQNLLENIDDEEQDKEETPFQLNIDLKDHQKIGLAWLKKMEEGSNRGSVLADDMGLGKTIEALALILLRPSLDTACKTTLIVAPLALLRQWEKEMKTKVHERHRLSVYIYHGPSKRQDFQYLRGFDVVMTTYGTLATELKRKEKWAPLLNDNPHAKIPPKERYPLLANSTKWYRIILDEAQNIKNKDALTSKAASQLKAITRLCMTGTPMMNNVTELYSLIRFLDIKPYCYWKRFREDIATPINKWESNQPAMDKLQVLWKAIALRRKKDSKINGKPIIELPPKHVEEVHVVFDEHQKQLYDGLESKAQVKFNKYLTAGKVLNNYIHFLVLLLRLRQLTCHPHLIDDLAIEPPGNMTSSGMKELAATFKPDVVGRIKEQDGSFQCPICLDATENPTLAFPCGHVTCLECFGRLINTAPTGEDDDTRPKCPSCRERLDADKVVDYVSFCRVHIPEKFPELEESDVDLDSDSSDDSDDQDTELEDDSLDGFVVKDDDDDPDGEVKYSRQQKAAKARRDKKNQARGKVRIKLFDSDGETKKSSKPVRKPRVIMDEEDEAGSGEQQEIAPNHKSKRESGKRKKPKVTLAQLKKESHRSIAARAKYLKRLSKEWKSSAKLDKTMEILESVRNNDPKEKIIIFSQWTSLLDLLEIPIIKAGWGYQRYDGGMKLAERVEAVEEFTESDKCTILLTSLKAGNAGLNLHQASQVIMLDPFWNPYIEEQAVDRAHRFPQSKTVHVHRILVAETVEDRIMALQEKKKLLIEAAMDETAGKNIARLGVAQFAYLFGISGYTANSQ